MPSSGARSGTTPSRSERGAGDGSFRPGVELACGHVSHSPDPVASKGATKFYRCPEGCGLVRVKRLR